MPLREYTVRLPSPLIARAEKYARSTPAPDEVERVGGRWNTASALRLAMDRGLSAMEAEQQPAPQPAAA